MAGLLELLLMVLKIADSETFAVGVDTLTELLTVVFLSSIAIFFVLLICAVIRERGGEG